MGIFWDDVLLNNRFLVAIGKNLYSFSRIANLSASLEYEAYQEGGYNDYPRLLRKPKTNMETIVFEKGMYVTSRNTRMEQNLAVGKSVEAVVIMVLNQREVLKHYYFQHGVITKWESGELDAMGNSVLIRKVEITHDGLHEGTEVHIRNKFRWM